MILTSWYSKDDLSYQDRLIYITQLFFKTTMTLLSFITCRKNTFNNVFNGNVRCISYIVSYKEYVGRRRHKKYRRSR